MPRILINGRFLTQPITGVQRYALEIVREFDRLLDEGHPAAVADELEVPEGVAGAHLGPVVLEASTDEVAVDLVRARIDRLERGQARVPCRERAHDTGTL